MAACLGHEACIATVLRLSLRYRRLSQLEEGYGITMAPLEKLVRTCYADDPAERFACRGAGLRDPLLMARMQKAAAVLQFNLEGQLVGRHPEWRLGHRLLLHRIDPAAGKIEAAWDTGSTGSHFIVMTPDAEEIYVSNNGDDLGVFDVRQKKFTTTLSLPRGSEGVTSSPDGRHVVAADNASGDLHVIDTATDRVVARVPLDGVPPSHPKRSRLMRPRFSPDGRFLIVTNYASATVHVMDTGNLRKQQVLVLAKGPMGAAFAEDNRSVLIASHDSGIVTAVDLEKRAITGWFEGGNGIETISYY
jgi:YVTN family beta-propeller protein